MFKVQNKIYKLLLICSFFFFSTIFYGQEIVFSHYGLKDGLSQSVINCIFQDSEGYIWFGTQNGLNRFDGYSFKKYLHIPSDTSSLTDNWIFAIAEDKQGDLWIGTKKGLTRYIKKTNKFQVFKYKPEDNSISNSVVNSLCCDSKGNILLNTYGYLIYIDPATNKVQHLKTGFPADRGIYDQNRPIIEDSHGNIWFGTQSGLVRFVPSTRQFTCFDQKSKPSLVNSDITALCEDREGNILVGTSIGLVLLDPITRKLVDFNNSGSSLFIGNPIKAIVTDKNNNTWLATENSGLLKLSYKNNKTSITSFMNDPNNPNGISHNIVYSLKLDNSGVLWVGTLNGIDKTDLKKKKFRLYRKTVDPNSVEFVGNVMASLFKDTDGCIWIGTWGSGLDIYNRNTGEIVHYASKYSDYRHIPNDFVHVIFKDSEKRLWIGTRNGLCIYDPDNKKFTDYRKSFQKNNFPDFKNIRIYCMIETSDRKFMIGTANGLHLLNPKDGTTQSFFAENSTISGNLVYSLMEDNDREIWIGTTEGLDRYNPGNRKFTHYRKNTDNTNSLIDNFVVSLCLVSDGRIWIGTNSGLCRLDKKTGNFDFFPDFPSNVVYDIIEDKNKDIWLSGGLGLTRFDSKTGEFLTYNIEDGLQSNEFNIKACFKAQDGELFFGGMDGFNSFYPDSLQSNNFIPKIAITDIEKENQQGKFIINPHEKEIIVLTHKDYALSIDFASMDYTRPEKNKYAYEMIGLSDKRIEYGNRRHVVFLNLPPGDYEFRVYGTNSDGIWNAEPATLKIRVLPPWWKSSYALTAYIIIIILLVFMYIKLRERRLKHEKRVLEERVKERTQEIIMQRDEIQAQRDEIEAQRNFVTEQRDQIASKNREIQDSILYAKRIQTAVLPLQTQFREYFSDFFVFYQPKDIVSGDFYWIKQVPDKCYFAVADCTGHGVPGAFVSMLGISFLNEIIQTCKIESAGDLLDKLRSKIKDALQQTGKKDETKDGMDISLVMIDPAHMKLEFAGANNHGMIIQNNKTIHLLADKMPIGIHGREQAFNTFRTDIAKGDIIYLFSDGYMDQFGGNARRKFMSKNFKLLLEEIHSLPMPEQYEKLRKIFVEWKAGSEQIDDVTVLGVKI